MIMNKLIQTLLGMFSRHPHAIEKLSETAPFRKAAKYAAYFYYRTKDIEEDIYDKIEEAKTQKTIKPREEHTDRLSQFKETFKDEFRKGLQDIDTEKKKIK